MSHDTRPTSPQPTVDRSDIEALLETRSELGSTYDSALLDSFVDRVEGAINARGSAQTGSAKKSARLEDQDAKRRWILGLVSLGVGLPITAVAAGIVGLLGVIVVWIGIVGVNVAHSRSS